MFIADEAREAWNEPTEALLPLGVLAPSLLTTATEPAEYMVTWREFLLAHQG